MMAFELSKNTFVDVLSYVSTIFWTVDLVFSFFVGYITRGLIEMRPRFIAERYLRTWFPFDICVVTIDWLAFILKESDEESQYGAIRMSKSLRAARFLRIMRLVRVVKLISLLGEFRDFIHSEVVRVSLGIMKFVLFILLVNHYIACMWYAIAEFNPVHERTWLDKFKSDTGQQNPTVFFRYTTALHWSVTQFTPASMEIHPANTVERVFAIGMVLL